MSVRAISASRFSIAVPDGPSVVRPGARNQLEEVASAASRLGFVRLPLLERRGLAWQAFVHPHGVVLSGSLSTAGSGAPSMSSLWLNASLDLGCFHSLTVGDNVPSIDRRLDGSGVGKFIAPDWSWSGDLFKVLRRVQSRGRIRSFAEQLEDLSEGFNLQSPGQVLPKAMSWKELPSTWAAQVEDVAPSDFVQLLKAEPKPVVVGDWAEMVKNARVAIENLRGHGKATGRRYWPAGHRRKIEGWVKQVVGPQAQACELELDWAFVAGGLSQLKVWTWMLQDPIAQQGIARWLALAPLETLRCAVLAEDGGWGWGDHLADMLRQQLAERPAISSQVDAWVSILHDRLGDNWVGIFTHSPLEPVADASRWSLTSHDQALASIVELAHAVERRGAEVKPPAAIGSWEEKDWEKAYATQNQILDWAPMMSYIKTQRLKGQLPRSVQVSSRKARF